MDLSDKNKIDSLFRESLVLSGRQPDFFEEEWEAMESLLTPEPVKKSNIIWLYRLAAGIAAGLLLFIGIRFAQKMANDDQQQMAVKPIKTTIKPNITTQDTTHQQVIGSVLITERKVSPRGEAQVDRVRSTNTFGAQQPINPIAGTSNKADTTFIKASDIALNQNAAKADTAVEGMNLAANSQSGSDNPVMIDTPATVPELIKNKPGIKSRSFNGPRVRLAILAAPDVNGVNSFKGAQTGGNFSLQASVKLTSKLSFTTGAAYAIKPYQTGFSNYRSGNPAWWRTMWANKPQDVMANCKVLDIPFNLDYQLFKKGSNDFSVGAGVSSYFMLNERYSFAFADPSATPAQLQVSNRNRNLFGVFNIEATYQHKLNSRFGLLIQPYAKLPFSRVGVGQVNLKSAGVAVGFNWNIHSLNDK